jgi:hypothetical protein
VKRVIVLAALLELACGAVNPAGPQYVVTSPTPCVGASCIVYAYPVTTEPPSVITIKPTLLGSVVCFPDGRTGVDCRINVALSDGTNWTSHVTSTTWSWSDGSTSQGYLTNHHVFPNTGVWWCSVRMFDDTGLSTEAIASFTVS